MAIDGFDLERLLAPIEGENPAGNDPRADYSATSPYNRLRDARSEARAAERAMDAAAEEATVPPQWRTIRELADTLLAEQAKDLEVAAWYTEALLRSQGFAGLAAGFQLMGGLVERFWEGLYPLPDEDGMLTKVAPVTGLNGEGGDGALTQPIRKVPLFRMGDGSPLALWQIEQADALESLDEERREARVAAGALTADAVAKAAAAVPAAHWLGLASALREASEGWTALGAALDERAGADAPPTSAVRELLQNALAVVTRLAGDKLAAAEEQQEADEAGEGEGEGEDAGAGGGGGGGRARATRPGEIASREDALKMLEEVARWFRRVEPHSPLSYTLEEAVRRGRMSLPDLLAELMPDETTRSGFLSSLGIRPPQAPSEEE
ncbi:type VI secretion system protein TssA [Elioraea rosea]|uniref:type VI secretion system protein TssA n=1 Tax=Elioraea rosea TaxID=2492390 RepID=UPI001185B328|nr:type VI secretion system protein TssA [Elioraea rosea]